MTKRNQIPKKNAYLKYSGLAFQMVGVILLAIFLGSKFDEWANTEKPYLTAITVLFAFGLFMYKLYIELIEKGE